MDLDKIKQTWNSAESLTNVSDDKIKQMLNNTGKSAYCSILKWENAMKYVIAFFILISPFLYHHIVTRIMFISFGVLTIIAKFYMVAYLKKIDMDNDLTTVTKQWLKYRKYVLYELIAGLIWAVVFLTLYVQLDVFKMIPDKNEALIVFVVSIIIACLLVLPIVWRLYWKKMKELTKSLKELKEFEN